MLQLQLEAMKAFGKLPGPCQLSTAAKVGIAVPIQSQSSEIKDKVKAFLIWNFIFTMVDCRHCVHMKC